MKKVVNPHGTRTTRICHDKVVRAIIDLFKSGPLHQLRQAGYQAQNTARAVLLISTAKDPMVQTLFP